MSENFEVAFVKDLEWAHIYNLDHCLPFGGPTPPLSIHLFFHWNTIYSKNKFDLTHSIPWNSHIMGVFLTAALHDIYNKNLCRIPHQNSQLGFEWNLSCTSSKRKKVSSLYFLIFIFIFYRNILSHGIYSCAMLSRTHQNGQAKSFKRGETPHKNSYHCPSLWEGECGG